MDEDIEARKRFIYEQVGEEALNILKNSGLDTDKAVTNLLKVQKARERELEAQAKFRTVDDIMTSELVYRSQKLEDIYGKEYSKRLQLIGLDKNQVNQTYSQEKLILSSEIGIFQGQREEPWARRYFIVQGVTKDNLPKPGQFTLSELIAITDDANAAFWRDHHFLSEETWGALCIAACCAQYTEARYAYAFKERVKSLGWSKEQDGSYTKNECLLLERLKWDRHENPAWTHESTDLKQFKR